MVRSPETMKITLKGTYEYPTTAKDLILFLLGKLGAAGALGKCVELYGEMIDKLSLPDRITVASMGTEMGAIAVMIPPNDEIIKFYRDKGIEFEPVYADPDAKYCEELEFDIQGLKPYIARPYHPEDTIPVEDVDDVNVDAVFIGSCTNGTYEDIKAAAEILKGKKVAPGVMVKAVPATKEVFGMLLKEGIINDLYDSGVIISNPGCGGCAQGQIGMTGKGEIQVSTSNRNFKGKQGAGLTYLASPVTAAMAAITGKVNALNVERV